MDIAALLQIVAPDRPGDVSPLVRELQRNRFIQFPQPGDDPLKIVLALGEDAQGIALNLGLDLGEFVSNQLAELAGQVFVEAAAQAYLLANLVAAGRPELAPIEDLEG
jgi:hypothetical protein